MDNSTTEFDKIENAAAEKRLAQDFDDLQNELSGNSVGRIQRFLSPEAHALLMEKRNGKQSAVMTALELALMNDPYYAEVYNNTVDRLRELEDATEKAIENAILKEQEAESILETTLDRAAQLPDGTRVFRDENDRVWTEFDQRVKASDAKNIEWRGNEPTSKQYHQDRAKLHENRIATDKLRAYQTDVLDTARERLMDTDNPLRPEELKEMEEGFSKRLSDMRRPEQATRFEQSFETVHTDFTADIPILK